MLFVAISQISQKSSEYFLSYARKYVNNCVIEKRGTFHIGEGAHKLDR